MSKALGWVRGTKRILGERNSMCVARGCDRAWSVWGSAEVPCGPKLCPGLKNYAMEVGQHRVDNGASSDCQMAYVQVLYPSPSGLRNRLMSTCESGECLPVSRKDLGSGCRESTPQLG